ncbi:hypothetical protein [Sphingomonas aquatilis]|uniref:hypothetical protein n=1 Tax=Sphingomonas aquatilis TaxID=93063 RepID=UPI0023F64BB1|nr:hypothetical protein [Sphingomonas aquatilis]MCI4653882.1 hypothetical protein [Sphingomonas aquatilis]
MGARALIREADLRRWAKIAREEGVAIHGHVDPTGGVTIRMSAAPKIIPEKTGDDLEDRVAAFASL